MLKFIVVEDNKDIQNIIVKVIDKALFKTKSEYFIEKFNSYCSGLKNAITDCSIQKVFILDINLGHSISGLEIAKKIRKNDWDSEIIFITSHDKMFETVYRNIFKVFDFIEKFILLEVRLEKDIKIIANKKADNGKFTYANNKIEVQIYYKDITHIYRDTIERKTVIKTTNNLFLLNKSISEILGDLDSRFVQVHRACIVNTERVNLYNWTKGYFVLDNGEQVDLCSKSFKENICV